MCCRNSNLQHWMYSTTNWIADPKKGMTVMTKDEYMMKELKAKIKAREDYKAESVKTDCQEAVEYDLGYIAGLKFALNMVEYCELPAEKEA